MSTTPDTVHLSSAARIAQHYLDTRKAHAAETKQDAYLRGYDLGAERAAVAIIESLLHVTPAEARRLIARLAKDDQAVEAHVRPF